MEIRVNIYRFECTINEIDGKKEVDIDNDSRILHEEGEPQVLDTGDITKLSKEVAEWNRKKEVLARQFNKTEILQKVIV